MGHWFESNLGEYSPGSSVGRATYKMFPKSGAIAQLVEFLTDIQAVVGPSPTSTTTNKPSFLRGIPIVEATLKN